MTREEAARVINECKDKGFKHTFYTLNEYHAALDMAIKALEQIELKSSYNSIKTELNDDAISRQAVIDVIENEQKKIMRSDWAIDQAKFSAMSEIRALIADLPSVSTEKTGRWIDRWDKIFLCENKNCSICGHIARTMYKFCPNCGAKMEVEE